ncbi:MAG: DUF3107 domain-containing protein [Mycobacteriales bacterium]|nr:DUF3107 domain-containing protein [Frankia sp.]
MEVKIGVQFAARELEVETSDSAADVEKAVTDAVSAGGVLTLHDERGRRVIVPVDKLAYVDIAPAEQRTVGFSRM